MIDPMLISFIFGFCAMFYIIYMQYEQVKNIKNDMRTQRSVINHLGSDQSDWKQMQKILEAGYSGLAYSKDIKLRRKDG